MEGYLGETIVDVKDTEFKDFTPADWAMYYIEGYGQIDGDHHKLWTLDQIARILKGTKVIVKIAKWNNGHSEYRIDLEEESKEYTEWVKEMMSGEDGEFTYGYDTGIAP